MFGYGSQILPRLSSFASAWLQMLSRSALNSLALPDSTAARLPRIENTAKPARTLVMVSNAMMIRLSAYRFATAGAKLP